WLEEGEALLQAEFARRQMELCGDMPDVQAAGAANEEGDVDLDEVVHGVQSFMQRASSYKGAEVDDDGDAGSAAARDGVFAEETDFGMNDEKFLKELSRALGLQDSGKGKDGTGTEESKYLEGESSDSDTGDDDSKDALGDKVGEDEEGAAKIRAAFPNGFRFSGKGVDLEDISSDEDSDADSDAGSDAGSNEDGDVGRCPVRDAGWKEEDEEGEWAGGDSGSEKTGRKGKHVRFMQEYDEVLRDQLRGTTLSRSFTQEEGARAAPESQASSAPIPPGTDAALPEEGLEDAPVNVDVNLLKGLLDSYSAQGGLPGPATNLLGQLGLGLPTDTDK
ncbi:hypothetical protein CYMTET_18203, partial [Cymbomonas tetramitiformis]